MKPNTNWKPFLLNFSGFDVSFYWAEFPSDYLHTIRHKTLDQLKEHETIHLRHTRPLSLVNRDERKQAIYDFISVLRCVTGGFAPVGHVRRDVHTPIHRDPDVEAQSSELD